MLRRLALAALVAVAAVASPAARGRVSAIGPEHVTLYRDSYGVPHIYGDTPDAAMYAFGYAQAQDHLQQMRQDYLMAAGRLAETVDHPPQPARVGIDGRIDGAHFDPATEADALDRAERQRQRAPVPKPDHFATDQIVAPADDSASVADGQGPLQPLDFDQQADNVADAPVGDRRRQPLQFVNDAAGETQSGFLGDPIRAWSWFSSAVGAVRHYERRIVNWS